MLVYGWGWSFSMFISLVFVLYWNANQTVIETKQMEIANIESLADAKLPTKPKSTKVCRVNNMNVLESCESIVQRINQIVNAQSKH